MERTSYEAPRYVFFVTNNVLLILNKIKSPCFTSNASTQKRGKLIN